MKTPSTFGTDVKSVLRLAAVAGFVFAGADASNAVTVTVSGTANPWLAGMPSGTTDPPDVAPNQSPAQVPGLNLSQGQALIFTVTGAVANCSTGPGGSCCPTCGVAFPSPDGAPPGQDNAEFFHHLAINGISDIVAPINSLIGVFLGPNQPNLTSAPSTLDFSSLGLGFSSLSPELKQTFFIGDGVTGTGSGNTQEFLVPAGATRVFLGTMDGGQWSNNSGEFRVSLVPEPSGVLLLALGVIVLVGYSIRDRRRLPT